MGNIVKQLLKTLPGPVLGKRPWYFATATASSSLHLDGQSVPFWDLVERQPDGWLISMSGIPKAGLPEIEDVSLLMDCGAWTYKDLKKNPKTAVGLCYEYDNLEVARPGSKRGVIVTKVPDGSFVIAPDHMLLDELSDEDLKLRRTYNREQAKEFLDHCPKRLIPMAAVHGQDTEERLDNADFFVNRLGYRYLAIGGLAARASQKERTIGDVEAVRELVPDVWIHALGLSSATYLKAWQEAGIEAADGAAFHRDAMRGSFWTILEGSHRIVKKNIPVYQRDKKPSKVWNDEPRASAPKCDCSICVRLRRCGIDTRQFGTTKGTVGRAVHNLNLLLRAHDHILTPTLVLVSCCGKKLQGTYKAQDIYTSPLFKKSKAWATKHGHSWAILSAKYGVLAPETKIADYDVTLKTFNKAEKGSWDKIVASQLVNWAGYNIVILAGEDYCGWAKDKRFLSIQKPLEGMKIGERLKWLSKKQKR